MHLINTQTLHLEEHIDPIPPYVILSHTWGDQEVTYQEMDIPASNRSDRTRQKAGYSKILATCWLAQQRMPPISHVWIDTCCIDKTSSAHLTENINSMYEFYTRAEICLVYLVDLPPDVLLGEGLKNCKWITRGWTLQEMIAPREIEFYGAGHNDGEWIYRGTKSGFCNELAQCTGVPRALLKGRISVASYSIARRMSWASRRKTTRPEDIAYCLFGIFGVNMPLIYGERETGAFRRLQESIIKKSNDMTIFAWEPISSVSNLGDSFCSIFAPSPANFRNSSRISPFTTLFHDPEYMLTNKGLRMEDRLYYVPDEGDQRKKLSSCEYVLVLGGDDAGSKTLMDVGVHLRKVGPDVFMREEKPLKRLSENQRLELGLTPEAPFYLLTHGDSLRRVEVVRLRGNSYTAETVAQFRTNGIRFPGRTSQVCIIPHGLWDSLDKCFLWTRFPLVRGLIAKIRLPPGHDLSTTIGGGLQTGITSASSGSKTVEIGVLMIWAQDRYTIRLFDATARDNLRKGIFSSRRNRETKEALRWREAEEQYPEIMGLKDELSVRLRDVKDGEAASGPVGSVFVVTARAVPEQVEGFYQDGQTVRMFRFELNVKEQTPDGRLLGEWDDVRE